VIQEQFSGSKLKQETTHVAIL